MGLENLKSIFTEGMKKMTHSDLREISKGPSTLRGSRAFPKTLLSDREGQSSFDNLKNTKVTDIRDSLTEGRLEGQLSITDMPRIGGGGNEFSDNNLTTGNTPDYKSIVYDPRTSRGRDNITPAGYAGTRFTKIGQMGDGESGIGWLFNIGANIEDAKKYSTGFNIINSPRGYGTSPTGNDIISIGNMGSLSADIPGGGYLTKKPLMDIYKSVRDIKPTNTYFPAGSSDINSERTIVKDNIPSFNNLTLGQLHTGTLGEDGVDILVSPLNKKLSSTSWKDYYNENHTSKPDTGYHYSAFVDRDKLDIRDTNSGDRDQEPYIVTNIGSRTNSNRFRPKDRAGTDVKRLSKFLKSPEGIKFFGKQNAYRFVNTSVVESSLPYVRGGFYSYSQLPMGKGVKESSQRFKKFYSPLSTLAIQRLRLIGQDAPQVKLSRNFPFGFSIFGDEVYEDSAKLINMKYIFTQEGGALIPPADEEQKAHFKKSGTSGGGLFGFSGGKLYSYGDVHTLTPLLVSTTDATKLEDVTEVKRVPTIDADTGAITHDKPGEVRQASYVDTWDGSLPFYFKDLRDNTYVIFRAYLDGIVENIVPAWNPTSYVGRSEPVYSYAQTERDLTFNLKLHAGNKAELKQIYTKMNRLTSMCYPQYAPDVSAQVKTGEDTEGKAQIRMRPPLVRLRLGDLFGGGGADSNMMLGFISTISYTVPEESTWEIDKGMKVPRYIMATIMFRVIHETVPSYTSQFYGKQIGEVSDNEGYRGGFASEVPS